ncbi:hypothetical protein [Rosistilla oblonga]|uniref:hypothetical protein n=1 Tax=Rosistilla oblonga TaxID=2527990 RepID=UPI003A977290
MNDKNGRSGSSSVLFSTPPITRPRNKLAKKRPNSWEENKLRRHQRLFPHFSADWHATCFSWHQIKRLIEIWRSGNKFASFGNCQQPLAFEKFTIQEESSMATSTLLNSRNSRITESHSDTTLSDFEIAGRVSAIRSNWSAEERVERHVEAARRFDALLEALNLDATPVG